MAAEMTAVVVLALRAAVVAALLLFFLAVLRTLRAELAAAAGASPAGPSDASDWLEVVDCDEALGLAGKLYPLEPTSIIGRDPGATVPIPDPRVSIRHARLVRRGVHWWVEDLGSTNGTYLNDRPVSGPTRLGRNDTLRLGPATLRVRSA